MRTGIIMNVQCIYRLVVLPSICKARDEMRLKAKICVCVFRQRQA
jgi:hypothetical protein